MFGGFQAFAESAEGSTPVTIRGERQQALLAYLALSPRQRARRERLAALFWGEDSGQLGRLNLRQCLARLKESLDEARLGILALGRDDIGLMPGSTTTDADELRSGGLQDDRRALAALDTLYVGPLLDGLDVAGEGFNEWLRIERGAAERGAAGLLKRLIQICESDGDLDDASAFAHRLVGLDPLNEEFQRLVLRLTAKTEGRRAALKAAAEIAAFVQREIGGDLEPETTALIKQIGAGLHDSTTASPGPVASVDEDASRIGDGRPSLALVSVDGEATEPSARAIGRGFVNDLSVALGRLNWIAVIGRSAIELPRVGPAELRRAGRTLGVRYLLEASTRCANNKLRVTVHLVSTEDARHVWTERYDRDLGELFAVQDDIIERVVAALEPRLMAVETRRAQKLKPEQLGAWHQVARAIDLIHRFEQVANSRARLLLDNLLRSDPDNATGLATMSWATIWASHCNWLEQDGHDLALAYARRALRCDSAEPWAHLMLGFAHSGRAEHAAALDHLDQALRLNPSFALGRMLHGWALVRAGRTSQAVEETGKALSLAAADNLVTVFQATHGLALMSAGRFEDALPHLRASTATHVEYMGHYNALASCLGHLGRIDEAAEILAFRERTLGRPLSIEVARPSMAGFAHADLFFDGLRRAGVPEASN